MMTDAQYKPDVRIASDPAGLACMAVRVFVESALEAIRSHGRFYVAISGGRTPKRFFETLAISPEACSLAWEKIHVFWVDERYVPPDSPQSNYKLAAETFLRRMNVPPGNIHRIATGYDDIGAAALAYERTIREVFGLHDGEMPQFDLVVLGMGADGHTASLFPNSCIPADVKSMVCAVRLPGVPVDRVTLTPPVLLAAKRLAVLVSGKEKSQTLKEVLTGEPDTGKYPIHLLWPALRRITWLVDADAAGAAIRE